MAVTRRLLLPIVLLISGCGSDVERVQSVGADKGDYRRSPCACFRLEHAVPIGEEAVRRARDLERALS